MRLNLAAVIASLASSGLAHLGLVERAACTTNACLAALASRTAMAKPDCSAFVITTVTPCPKTVKSTITVTSTYGCPAPVITTSAIVSSSALCPLSSSPSAVPSYAASACSNGSAFSSACGCLNVRASHTTVSPSTVTATKYKTVKVTPTFVAKAVEGVSRGQYLTGGPPEGQGHNGPHDGGTVYFVSSDVADAEYYTIDANGTVLGGNGTLQWGSAAQNCRGCYFQVNEYPPDAGYGNVLKCRVGTILRGDGYLSFDCHGPQGGKRFQDCVPDSHVLDLGGTPDASLQCTVLTLGAYPVCP